MFNYISKFGIIIVIFFLTGCAGLGKGPTSSESGQPGQLSQGAGPNLSWDQRQARLSSIHSWTLNSAFSINQQNKVSMANLHWTQQGSHFNQTITGPFSLGGIRVEGTPGRVTLWKSQQRVTAGSPEQLLQKEFGWHLPISSLYYWIRGLPVPGSPSQQRFDQQHRLAFLQQQNWRVQYLGFQTVNGIDLPSRMTLSNARLQVRIVVKNWQIG